MKYEMGSALSRHSPKRLIFAQFALLAKAMGHPVRIELLEHLAQGERSVDALAQLVGVPVANISQHLQQLRRSGLVASRRNGKFVVYRLADDRVITLIASVREVAERNIAEVERLVRTYFEAGDRMEAVSREELLTRMKEDLVTVIDVRPADEYDAAHLPGAINIPLPQLEQRIGELDPDRSIVAYCRGPYCVFAFEAVAALRRRGLAAQRLQDGLPEWKNAGLPIVAAGGEQAAASLPTTA